VLPAVNGAPDTHFVLEIYDSISETLATKVVSFKEAKFVARGLLSNTSYILVAFSKNRRGESNKIMQPVVTKNRSESDSSGVEVEEDEIENFLKMQDRRTDGDETSSRHDLRDSPRQGESPAPFIRAIVSASVSCSFSPRNQITRMTLESNEREN
jgi:hypothetical protein